MSEAETGIQKKEEKKIEKKLEENIKKTFETSNLDQYIRYLRSPWRIFWSNLLAGISRGVGFILGVTVVLGGVVWFIAKMVDVPLVGEYFAEVETSINEYKESTNYKDEFQSMEQLLQDISTSLKR